MDEATIHRVAVVVFVEVEVTNVADARFFAETAVKQAFRAAQVPGMAEGYVAARLPRGTSVPVRVARTEEINCARDSLVITPVARVFIRRGEE
jgi:hypothetical protein